MDRPMYHEGMRQLQDARDTRVLADRLEQVISRDAFTPEDRAFIERSAMMFVATADTDGRPDCSYKGGVPGFVQVLDTRTLLVPDYDGNGMYRSWGNVMVNAHVGLLFIDFENPKRLRVNGSARVVSDAAVLQQLEGAVFAIRIEVERIFPNCPRYLHRMKTEEVSAYAPRACYTPPVPGWKSNEQFRDALPARDRLPPDPAG